MAIVDRLNQGGAIKIEEILLGLVGLGLFPFFRKPNSSLNQAAPSKVSLRSCLTSATVVMVLVLLSHLQDETSETRDPSHEFLRSFYTKSLGKAASSSIWCRKC
jgi:hypothetical protein